MKKALFPLLSAGALLLFSCQSNNNQPAERAVAKDSISRDKSVAGTAERTNPVTRDREMEATVELCTCVNSYLADMSPQVRDILVKAGKSSAPMQTLAAELQQVKGTAEQERLLREFQKFENDTQLQRCSEGVKAKYNLDENDTASRAKILKAAEEARECEVVYALMKIGLEQERMAGAGRKQR